MKKALALEHVASKDPQSLFHLTGDGGGESVAGKRTWIIKPLPFFVGTLWKLFLLKQPTLGHDRKKEKLGEIMMINHDKS